jgi:hypothetical protein
MRKLADDIANTELEGEDIDPVRLAELVLALDGWLQAGGFLPAAWKKASQGLSS